MASVLDNLNAAKANVAANLAAITATPKPSYSIDGKSVSWAEYFAMLTEQMAAITRLINAEAPYEVRSYGR